ncbi:hypothetical protein OZX73_00355 [Bifidobacterium sp. ESL0775]|uniref:hypothetical protein n=1 Tax=Bifidobacterium sp. ESL0775 TaxID=2983230 RepID=UPI0023F758FC|nr:hypothetical protein [Bifidobacterium sp. ESL0775]WEV69391.1 hypothetical protein OZX73_00355 [Bifidobacterium sp. ESL0775]
MFKKANSSRQSLQMIDAQKANVKLPTLQTPDAQKANQRPSSLPIIRYFKNQNKDQAKMLPKRWNNKETGTDL